MPVTTTSAAVHLAPVVVKTFFEHGKRKAQKLKDGQNKDELPQDDIFFDEAFHIVKAFITMGTRNKVESLQAFTNTHVPAPYWAAVSPVLIPLSSCNHAADVLIDWFGLEELKHVVGGERWWQVRGLDGIDGEWITQKKYLDQERVVDPNKNLSLEEENILRMEKLDKVMLYIHGGGYFWGSINTHRYQIIRYARKFQGRAFAVNYRKAPQYPWPCPLHDVIAAYLYLIQPPPDALHAPVPPSKIILAGDSAGGGLCVTLMTVLRDMGIAMPAGAVLISPWVDLTHSFPSVMENSNTDIIPKHGFLAKPSTLWPVTLLPPDDGRVVPTTSNPPPKPGHADTLKPSKERLKESREESIQSIPATQEEMLSQPNTSKRRAPHVDLFSSDGNYATSSDDEDLEINYWEPKPSKVLMENPDAIPLELRSQIQMYATTEQLSHPLVSPILQGSLGNLPPLYILAGDGEVLRDEIIYLAHRAAHPAKYPVRSEVLRDGRRQKENAENFTKPTRVHLQLFDGMCHVLTVFSFTKSAEYAYRSIAEFVKHVGKYDEAHLDTSPFPKLHRPPTQTTTDNDPEPNLERNGQPFHHKQSTKSLKSLWQSATGFAAREDSQAKGKGDHVNSSVDVNLFQNNESISAQEINGKKVDSLRELSGVSSLSEPVGGETKVQEISNVLMLRERVNIFGVARPMEPVEYLQALQIPTGQIGIIKEAPTLRWLKGQEEWDKKYRRHAVRALERRHKYEVKAKKILQDARDQGLIHDTDGKLHHVQSSVSTSSTQSRRRSKGKIQTERRWGPLDLNDENPPPSAIAKRHDTPEALALLKKSIYHTAPVTHHTIPKRKMVDEIRAAFDPHDDPNKPPRQSVSEQQVRTQIFPVHGLRMWDNILRYFGRKSSQKAIDGVNGLQSRLTEGLKT